MRIYVEREDYQHKHAGMYTYTSARWMLASAIALLFLQSSPATHAAFISDQDLEDQQQVVATELVETLREQVKYLQMLLIRKLEGRVAELRAELQARH